MPPSLTVTVPSTPTKPEGEFSFPSLQIPSRNSQHLVLAVTLTADESLTATIDSEKSLFVNPVFYLSDLVLVDKTPHPALYPVYEWEKRNTVVSNATPPLSAKKGQFLEIKVTVNTSDKALTPGLHQGSMTLKGTSFTSTVPLRVMLLGVDLSSPIGKKWMLMGGGEFFGEVISNPEIAPNGNGRIQEFENGVLYHVASKYLPFGSVISDSFSPRDSISASGNSTFPGRTSISPIQPHLNNFRPSPSGKVAPPSPGHALMSGLAVADNKVITPSPRHSTLHSGSDTIDARTVPVVDSSYYDSVVFWLSNNVFAKFVGLSGLKGSQNQSIWDELQYPVEDTFKTSEGGAGEAIRFQGGSIIIRSDSRAFVTYGAIYSRYEALGDISSSDSKKFPFVGWPISDEEPIGRGRRSRFEMGDIYWAQNLAACEIHGDIRGHWESLGGTGSVLGFPVTNEKGASDGIGRFNRFEKGAIYWTPATGPCEMHGEILTRWRTLGEEVSYLGYPTSDVLPGPLPSNLAGENYVSYFMSGAIYWTLGSSVSDVAASVDLPSQPVLTPSGTALGGTISVSLWSNGDYRFLFEIRDTGFPDYDFNVNAIVTSPGGLSLASSYQGHIEGSESTGIDLSPPKSRLSWEERGNDFRIQQNWSDLKNSTLWVTKDYSATGLVGVTEDLAKAFYDAAGYGIGAGLGVVIGLGSGISAALGNLDLGFGGTIGILAGAVVFVYGGGIVLATVAGVGAAVVTNSMIDQKDFPSDVYDAVSSLVFGSSLPPRERLRLTNLTGLRGKKFTILGMDNMIYLNMGDFYDDPWPTTNPGDSPDEQDRKRNVRQTLVHELTHAWQIQHSSFTPGLMCDSIHTSLDRLVGQSVYQYGPPDTPWDKFTTEAQARVVEEWFAGTATVNVPFRSPCNDKDPYFGYIRDIVRRG